MLLIIAVDNIAIACYLLNRIMRLNGFFKVVPRSSSDIALISLPSNTPPREAVTVQVIASLFLFQAQVVKVESCCRDTTSGCVR